MKRNNPEWEIKGHDSWGRPVYHKNKAVTGVTDSSLSSIRSEIGDQRIIPADIHVSDLTNKVINHLSSHGMTAYLVGGKIRDHLMGLDSKDVDIEVYGADSISHLESVLSGIGGKVGIAGKSFGVVKYSEKGEEFDVSLPRRDSLGDGDNSHRSIDVDTDSSMTPYEASLRRDFTFNSLMYDPLSKNVIDHHGGVNDIRDGVISVVDERTFTDDPLRVLRGIQFAGRFDFDMDEDTIRLCRTMTWKGLAKERIAGEIHKMIIKSRNLHQGIVTLNEVGWDDAVPGLVRNLDNPLDQSAITKLQSMDDDDVSIGLVSSLMDHHYGEGKGYLASSLMLTGKQRKSFRAVSMSKVDDIVSASRMRRYLHSQGIDQEVLDIMSSAVGKAPARKVWDGIPPRYTVDGDYLMGRGLKPGPVFGEVISKCADIEDSGGSITDDVVDDILSSFS